jgi:hypothetical protein
MGSNTLADVYLAQAASSAALPAASQQGIWDFATRTQDTRILQALAGRPDLIAPLLADIAKRGESAVRVAYLTRLDVDTETVVSSIAGERRAGVLADLLRSDRAAADPGLVQRIESIISSALTTLPTKVLAEAVVAQPSLSLAVRVSAIEILKRYSSLPVSTISAMRNVLEQARRDEEYSVRATVAAGAVAGLRADALALNGIDASTRIEMLRAEQLIHHGPLRIPTVLTLIELMLDEVDDLQPSVLVSMREIAKQSSRIRPRHAARLDLRIINYIPGDQAEQRRLLADAISQVSKVDAAGIDDAMSRAIEFDHPEVALALLGNHALPEDLDRLCVLMEMLPIAELVGLVRERRSDIWTLAAYLADTAAMIHADSWLSFEHRLVAEIAVARHLRDDWDDSVVADTAALVMFASSGVSSAALMELPWPFFVEVAGSYHSDTHASWISAAMTESQNRLDGPGQWETLELLGADFTGSLAELVVAASTL